MNNSTGLNNRTGLKFWMKFVPISGKNEHKNMISFKVNKRTVPNKPIQGDIFLENK